MLEQNFFKTNRERFYETLESPSTVVLYSGREIPCSLDSTYPFYPDNNFYYLTGLREPDNVLVIQKDDSGSIQETLFIPERDVEKEKWVGYRYTKNQAYRISGIEDIRFTNEFLNFADELPSTNVYVDLSQKEHQRLKLNTAKVHDISDNLAKLRLIKQDDEIEALKKAIDITNEGLNQILFNLHPGCYEYELAADFEHVIKRKGAEELSFPTIAASGPNGPILHYIKNDRLIGRDELLLLDLGARYKGYSADVSRTYPSSGKFTELQERFYKALLKTQKEIIKEYKPGRSLVDLQKLTKDTLAENLVKEGIKLPAGGIDEWYYHSIGHSLGLDTHDSNDRTLVLEKGMVITCEPGVYAREYNIGIRIEDDILVTDDEPIVLTQNIPKEIDEIYRLMK